MISSRLDAIAAWAAMPCCTGMIPSRSPHTIRVGTRAARYKPVAGVDGLAADVDHAAHRADERLPVRRTGERAVPAPQLGELRRVDVVTAEEPADVGRTVDERLRERDRHDVLGTGERQRPQQPADLAAESAAADEHEPVDEFGMLVGELHRHAAAEGVPDDGDAADVEHGEEVAQSAGERAERVVAHRLGRLAVAEQVGSDHVVALGERRHDGVPRARTARQPVDEQHDLALEPCRAGDRAFGWPARR